MYGGNTEILRQGQTICGRKKYIGWIFSFEFFYVYIFYLLQEMDGLIRNLIFAKSTYKSALILEEITLDTPKSC